MKIRKYSEKSYIVTVCQICDLLIEPEQKYIMTYKHYPFYMDNFNEKQWDNPKINKGYYSHLLCFNNDSDLQGEK